MKAIKLSYIFGTPLQILVLILFWGYIHLLSTCCGKKRRNHVSTKNVSTTLLAYYTVDIVLHIIVQIGFIRRGDIRPSLWL